MDNSQPVQKKARNLDMTKGSILKNIVLFSIPLLIGNLFQQLYNMVDSMVVGNFVGDVALAAVGTSWTPIQILIAMFLGIGTGATIMVAQSIGAGDIDNVRQTICTGNVFLLVVSLPLTLLGIFACPYILRFMNVPDDAFQMAYEYIFVLFIGTLPNIGYNMNAGVLRGLGDSRAPLISLIISSIVNIVLDLLFVAVFNWAVIGVGIATVIAQFAAWIYSIVYIKKKYPHLEFKVFDMRVSKPLLKSMVRLGLPIGFNNAVFAFGFLFLTSLVNMQGSTFMAGTTAASRVDNLVFLPIVSFGAAATTFAGQNVGAGQHERLKKGLKTIMLLTLVVNEVLTILILFFSKPVLMLFNQEPEVLTVGANCIWWIAPWYWFYVIFHIFNSYMNGAGEVRLPTISSLVMFWAVRLPFAYFMADLFGRFYIYACYPVSWAAGALISGVYFATGRWKRHYLNNM